jgi:hypothetical protein
MHNETTQKKETNMKTNRIPSLLLAVTSLAALTLATLANAQFLAVSDDGIAAPPKVRQMLNDRNASAAPAVAAAPSMACPMCKDLKITEVNPFAKGGQVLAGTNIKTVVNHTCPACQTTQTIVGEGKARHTVATHKCAVDLPNKPANCCASN